MSKKFYIIFTILTFLYLNSVKDKNLSRLYVIFNFQENKNLAASFSAEDLIYKSTLNIKNFLNYYKLDKTINYEKNQVKKNSHLLSNNFHQVYFFSDQIKKEKIQELKLLLNNNLIQKYLKIELIYVE